MQYLTSETESLAAFNAGLKTGAINWQPTKAKTQAAAKRVAQSSRVFQNTIAHVAFITADAKIIPLAHRIGATWQPSETVQGD